MKFGKQLVARQHPAFQGAYVEYKAIKNKLEVWFGAGGKTVVGTAAEVAELMTLVGNEQPRLDACVGTFCREASAALAVLQQQGAELMGGHRTREAQDALATAVRQLQLDCMHMREFQVVNRTALHKLIKHFPDAEAEQLRRQVAAAPFWATRDLTQVLQHLHQLVADVFFGGQLSRRVHNFLALHNDAVERAKIRAKHGFIIDMDGVIYHDSRLLPGAAEFVRWLQDAKKRFLFLTNGSTRTPAELRVKLAGMGVHVDDGSFYTSAITTAQFLHSQLPFGSAYVLGSPALVAALEDVGYTITAMDPDYVVVGEVTGEYSLDVIRTAIELVQNGARLIGTNLDVYDKVGQHHMPSCGALISPIQMCTGVVPYFCGKPNPRMMRQALKKLGVHTEDAIMVGDRMDTDIVAGLESGLDTLLVLSGVTSRETMADWAYRPTFVLPGVGHVPPKHDDPLSQPAPVPVTPNV